MDGRRSGNGRWCGRGPVVPTLLTVGTLLGVPGARAQDPTVDLQRRAEELVAGSAGEWSIVARRVSDGHTLIAINPSLALIPASNNKIFTAIWALDVLGPEYRFPTDLLIDGRIEDGALRGDVVLRGSGDPAFGYPRGSGAPMFVEDPMSPLRRMASRLVELGIARVDGSIVADATAFDSIMVGPRWPDDTGGGAAQYAPRVSGLAFHRNLVHIDAAVREPEGIEIRVIPAVRVVPIVSSIGPGGGRPVATRRPNDDTVRIRGGISARAPARFAIGVADPALVAADALRSALSDVGVMVAGDTRRGTAPKHARVVHRHYSIPVALMVPLLGQRSDNFFAEHLWKATVRAAVGEGSFDRGGVASALYFIRHVGVAPGELYQADGSGLSSFNRASANAIVAALLHAHARPYSESWHRSLAVAGDRSGTLNRLFRGTTAAGNLHAKTGYIRGARTLSGYVRTRDGELIAFSFLYNGPATNHARGVQQELGTMLAEYAAPGS